MRMHLFMLSCALAGCAAPEAPPLPEPPPPVIAASPARVAPPPAVPQPVARVITQFAEVEETEMHAVTRPHVTPEFVREVHAAHLEARKAVSTLERQKRRPSPVALGNAQTAVSKLGDVLATAPDDKP